MLYNESILHSLTFTRISKLHKGKLLDLEKALETDFCKQ